MWLNRTENLHQQIFSSWLSLLRDAERVNDDDPERIWVIAKCCHELGWYRRAHETLALIPEGDDADTDLLVAKLRFEMNPSNENAKRLTGLAKASKNGVGVKPRMERNARRALVGLAVVAVCVAFSGLHVRHGFVSAHEHHVVRAALGELIVRANGGTPAQSGEIGLPVSEDSFGKGPAVFEFVRVVNARFDGRLRYFVFEEGGVRRFVVIDGTPAVVAAGVVPKDRLAAFRR